MQVRTTKFFHWILQLRKIINFNHFDLFELRTWEFLNGDVNMFSTGILKSKNLCPEKQKGEVETQKSRDVSPHMLNKSKSTKKIYQIPENPSIPGSSP